MRNLLLYLLLLLTLLSCSDDKRYPAELVAADTAFMHGDYAVGDSLLAAYDRTSAPEATARQVFMYRDLLRLTSLYVAEELPVSSFSMADSLCRYYRWYGSRQHYVQSLLLLGSICNDAGDIPAALSNYSEAIDVASSHGYSVLLCWANQDVGNIYFRQGIYEQCISCYRRFYALASFLSDTLRMANACMGMGRVCVITDKADSAIYYYRQAITLSRHLPQKERIEPYANVCLGDIYTQLGRFDEAANVMRHDTLHLTNWAYWHLEQNHTDSAIYYLKKSLGVFSTRVDVENLTILENLEERRGNVAQALTYYAQLNERRDTLESQSRSEELLLAQTRHEHNVLREKRDAEDKKLLAAIVSGTFVTVVLLLCILLLVLRIKRNERKKEEELLRERQLRAEMERQRHLTVRQIEKNKKDIADLQQQLEIAQNNNDTILAGRLRQDTDVLLADNGYIEASINQRRRFLDQLHASRLYQSLLIEDGDKSPLTDEEWVELAQMIDNAYDNFTERLLRHTSLSVVERRVCCLVKLGISPTVIASVLPRTKSAVSKIRSRLHFKIAKKKGSASDFDALIQEM